MEFVKSELEIICLDLSDIITDSPMSTERQGWETYEEDQVNPFGG